MDHYGSLETLPVSGDVHNLRGTTVRGSDGQQLDNVDDVIFDYDTMQLETVPKHSANSTQGCPVQASLRRGL
jgi:uncharacterized protein YrrD